MQGKFGGKTAIVTGGASGIGEATVEGLLKGGANAVIAEVNKERGEALARRLSGDGGRAIFVPTDVTKPDSITAAVDRTLREFGRIDILVNNAGGDSVPCDGIKMSLEDWRFVFDLNVTAAWLATSAVIDQMAKQGGGSIVNVSSMLAIRHSPMQSVAYASAKAALIRLSEVTAARYADKNIRVNVVAPGVTVTQGLRSLLSAEQLAGAISLAALRKAGGPEDQAAAILFLCSDDAGFITGQTMRVDGGWSVT